MNKYSIDLFLEACGANGPLEFELEDHEHRQIERRVVHQPFTIIGRDFEADLAIDHQEVSHRHTYLQLIGGRLFAVDLASRSGTFWEEKDQSAGWLDRNQSLRVGPVSFRLLKGGKPLPEPSESDRELNPLSSQLAPAGDDSGATLEFVNMAAERPPWRLNRALAFIGRSPLCRVQLASQTVSKFHASLVRTPKGTWVVDLLGKDGTYVNGVRVRSARLDDGDRLRIGKFVIRVILDKKAPEEAPAEADPAFVGEAAQGEPETPPVVPESLPAPCSRSETLVAAPQAWEPQPVRPSEPAIVPAAVATPFVELLQKGEGEYPQSLLAPLVNQFGQMQQQMFDQFQQALMMMVQMFGNLHKDQMAIVRQELDRLHQLTRELHKLQNELARTRRAPPPPPSRRTASAARIRGSEISRETQKVVADEGRPRLTAGAKSENGNHIAHQADAPKAASFASAAPSTKEAAAERSEPSVADLPDEHIHAQLSDRIAALQREQQGLWQRIVSSLVGKQDKPMP